MNQQKPRPRQIIDYDVLRAAKKQIRLFMIFMVFRDIVNVEHVGLGITKQD